jgi:hypothetical protein
VLQVALHDRLAVDLVLGRVDSRDLARRLPGGGWERQEQRQEGRDDAHGYFLTRV